MDMENSVTLALSGGVGGAKLSLGLAKSLPEGDLHVLVNTGDDFEHLGLHICPDIDTHLYTLSGRASVTKGWGIEGETWQAMAALEELGGETWFQLGDRDLATHLWRTRQLAQGRSLSEVTAGLAERLGVRSQLFPMSDAAVRTTVQTTRGSLAFQHYFVRERCEPAVEGFSFEGSSAAHPNRAVAKGLETGVYRRIVICPSNPFVSIDPILQIPGLWLGLRDNPAPVILVSPIVAGKAIKGPTAKMMNELGVPVTALGVAEHYCQRYPGMLDYFVIDQSDATLGPEIEKLGVRVEVAPTVMKTLADKQRLAEFCLALGE